MGAQLCRYLIFGWVFLACLPFANAQIKIDSTRNNLKRYSIGLENLNELYKEAFRNIIYHLSEVVPELCNVYKM